MPCDRTFLDFVGFVDDDSGFDSEGVERCGGSGSIGCSAGAAEECVRMEGLCIITGLGLIRPILRHCRAILWDMDR
jgi:hypothetical protein